MRLSQSLPAFEQIQLAIDKGYPLMIDARGEALGDIVACIAVGEWITRRFGVPVQIVQPEGEGRTPFRLIDYDLPEGITATNRDPYYGLDTHVDIHTQGNGDSLWLLNPYLATIGIHPHLALREPKERTDEIVFCVLTGAEYNERRNMDTRWVRQSVDTLRAKGYNVTILYDKEDRELPDAVHLPFDRAIERLSTAAVVIGGDTGFSHLAAAFGTPVVGLYPSWREYRVGTFTDSIRVFEWWGIPPYIHTSYLPNAPLDKLRVVQLMDAHSWSLDHLLQSVESFKPSIQLKKQPLIIMP